MNIWKIIKSMSKQLIVTAKVIVVSIAVMLLINPTVGIILLMIYSAWMVVKSSNKEMPLNKFTAIISGLMSFAIFFIMLILIGVDDEEIPLLGLGLGVIPGWLLARGHKVYEKNGIVYAKRTFFYVFIWVLSLLFTQGSTLLGMREVTDFGLFLNGFSTAMMVVLSIILFMKINHGKNLEGSRIVSVIFILIITGTTQSAQAVVFDGQNEERLAYDVGKFIFSSDLTLKLADVCKAAQASCKTTHDQYPSKGKYHSSYSLPNESIYAQIVYFTLIDKQTYTNSPNSNWVSSKCGTKGQYNESMLFGGPLQVCNINTTEYTYSGQTGEYGWWIMWEYDRWIVKLETNKYYKVPGNLPDNAVKMYMTFALDSIAKNLTTVEIQKSQTTSQSDLSSQSRLDSSNSNDDFASFVDKISSDENLKSLSYDNWKKTKETEETNHNPTPKPEPEPIKYWDDIDQQKQKEEIEKVKPKPTPTLNPYPDPYSLDLGFSDGELATGAAAALLMLLASLGLNASMIAAQETGELVMEAAEEAVADADIVSNSPLFDPYDDEQLPEENGIYWDGYGERWMTRDEAEHFVSKLNQEKSEADTTRERELDAFEDKNEIDRDKRQNERAEKLRDEGNIYNEKHETWEKSSYYVPPRTDLDRFYTHVDYLEEHSHQLSDDRKEIVERILDRIGYENNAIDATNLTDENMQTMDTLTKSINTIIHSEYEGKIAQQDSSTFEDYETLGEGIEYVGKQFGEAAEHMLTKGQTKGAITSFIYETAGNHDKSIFENLKSSTFESVKTYSGNRWADMADEADKIGEITINAAWGAMMETGEQLNEGKGMDGWEILKAAGEEAITDQLRSVFSDAAKGELDKIAEIKTKLKLDHISNQNSSELSDGFVDGVYKRFNHLAEQFDVNFDALYSQHFSEVADTLDGAFKNLAERLDDI